MADRLAGELERHFQRSYWRGDGDLVFAHPATGHVLDASKLRKRFRAALARAGAGAPDLTFHELRHTFGTQMAAARRAAAGDPGVDGSRRCQHDGDLRALRARSDRRGGVRAACIRRIGQPGHGCRSGYRTA